MTRGNPGAWDRNQTDSYKEYDTNSTYTYDPGVMVLPVASATPKTVKVRYHGGHGIRTVSFTATKFGNPPVIPAPQDTVKDTLISANVAIPMPIPDQTSNSFGWRVSGSYVYVTTDAPRIPGEDYLPVVPRPYPVPADSVAAGMLQGSTLDAIRDRIEASDFDKGTYLWPFHALPKIFFNPDMVI